ncbi:hypothetical protein WJX84_001958 [Apatococcus fuscideae]|uniref:Uncharacterized protein n=1 Tax=Apatococcus fuscideae TaxID=2026836 RepID=A0AAW1SWC8_9CHLO
MAPLGIKGVDSRKDWAGGELEIGEVGGTQEALWVGCWSRDGDQVSGVRFTGPEQAVSCMWFRQGDALDPLGVARTEPGKHIPLLTKHRPEVLSTGDMLEHGWWQQSRGKV